MKREIPEVFCPEGEWESDLRMDAAGRWLKSQYSGMVRRLGFKRHRQRKTAA